MHHTVDLGEAELRQPKGHQGFCSFPWWVSEQPCGVMPVGLLPLIMSHGCVQLVHTHQWVVRLPPTYTFALQQFDFDLFISY